MRAPYPMLTKNFGGSEVYQNRHGYIPEVIPEIMWDRMEALAKNVLQPLRDLVQVPLTVNRWWADEQLNKLQGGVKNSQHTFGEAADLASPDLPVRMVFEKLIRGEIDFDQAIFYPQRGFIHVSLLSDRAVDHANRRESLVNPYTKSIMTARQKAGEKCYFGYDRYYHPKGV